MTEARKQNPDGPRQIFYDREEVRAAMGIDDEIAFVEGLVWAAEQGLITAEDEDKNYLQ